MSGSSQHDASVGWAKIPSATNTLFEMADLIETYFIIHKKQKKGVAWCYLPNKLERGSPLNESIHGRRGGRRKKIQLHRSIVRRHEEKMTW